MKTRKTLTILFMVWLLSLFTACDSWAAPIGTAFTYQGRLIDANTPADGLYDFQFKLYDDPNANFPLAKVNVTEVDVIDGYFTVELDFGSGIFDGNARWLEIGVRPGGFKDPNTYTTLSPRQQVTPTPYALYAASANVSAPLSLTGSVNSPGAIISGTNISDGRGVFGDASNSGNVTNFGGYFTAKGKYGRGVYGLAEGSDGRGVFGEASNTGVYVNYGGYFEAAGANGRGVHGSANNVDGVINYGGYFTAAGSSGRGVYGEATGYSGRGVYGSATNTGDFTNYGGYFQAAGRDSKGVYGKSTGGFGEGICGEATGNSGKGVSGFAIGSWGTGVWGVADGSYGVGVYGRASNMGEYTNYGGYFSSEGKYGTGVYGASTGSEGVGVFGSANGSNGIGVIAVGRQYDFFAYGPGTDYGSSSSIRWKSNIRLIDDPLGKVMNLRGVYFNWDAEHGGGHDVGMVAEEVGEVLPEIVEYEENGIDATGMDYGKLTPLLVEAVKTLKAENDALKTRIEVLEAKMQQVSILSLEK